MPASASPRLHKPRGDARGALLTFDRPLDSEDAAFVASRLREGHPTLQSLGSWRVPDWIRDAATDGDDTLQRALAVWLALLGIGRRQAVAVLEPDATEDHLQFLATLRALHRLRRQPALVVARWISLPGQRRAATPPLVWPSTAAATPRRRGAGTGAEPQVRAVLHWLERVCLDRGLDARTLAELEPAVCALVPAIFRVEGRCGADDLRAAVRMFDGGADGAATSDDPRSWDLSGVERLPAAVLVARPALRAVSATALRRLAALLLDGAPVAGGRGIAPA